MTALMRNRYIIILITMIFISNILICVPLSAVGPSVLTLSASYSSGKVNVSGTTSENVLAVAILLYDTDGTTLLRMETFGVNDQSFAAQISISLSSGTYTVKAADYNGGPYATASFTRTSSSGSGGDNGSESTTIPPTTSYTAGLSGAAVQDTLIPVTVDIKAGTGTVKLEETNAEELFSGSVISMPSISGVDVYMLEMPASILSNNQGAGQLTIATETANLVIPDNMLSTTPEAEGKVVTVSIGKGEKTNLTEEEKATVGNRPLIQLTLKFDGKVVKWNNPKAPVIVSIPYTPTAEELNNPESIIIWYLDGSGELVCIPSGRYDLETGKITFNTTHFSLYAVGYNTVKFNDVESDAWYSKAVSFIASRKITSGTGEGNYSPTNQLTRSEFIVMLMRAYSIAPDSNPSNNFSDAGNAYYTNYLATAKRLGISAGVGNNLFAPDRNITRQEMFTMLYNALKVISMLPEGNNSDSLSSFSDAKEISLWAREAIKLFVGTGTIVGSDGKLSPQETTTRAQMAQVLYSLLSKCL